MSILKQAFNQFFADRCTTMAAALAYYALFALPPLLFLLFMVLTFSLSLAYEGDTAELEAQKILEQQTSRMVGDPAVAEQLASFLRDNQQLTGKWWRVLLSLAGIMVGATGLVVAIQDSLNRVWSVERDPERSGLKYMLRKRVLSFVMILGLGGLLLLSVIVSTALTMIGDHISDLMVLNDMVAHGIDYTIQALLAFVTFTAVFRFMPDAEVDLRDVAVGAAITTALFLLGRLILQFYLANSPPGAQLGSAAASLAAILVWGYYTSAIFLFGAEVTQAYSTRFGDGIKPVPGAVRVVRSFERADQ